MNTRLTKWNKTKNWTEHVNEEAKEKKKSTKRILENGRKDKRDRQTETADSDYEAMKKSKLDLRHYKNPTSAGQIRVSFCDNANMSEQSETRSRQFMQLRWPTVNIWKTHHFLLSLMT